MKKGIIGLLLIAFLVVLIGFLFKKEYFTLVPLQEEKIIELNDIKIISFQTNATDIEITSGSSNHILVKLEGKIAQSFKHKYHINIEELNNQLKISFLPNADSLGIKFGGEKDLTLQITLPERTYEELLVQTTSGDINTENITAKNMEIISDSGDQIVKNLNTTAVSSMMSTSGSIKIEHGAMENFLIESISGDVEMQELISQRGQAKTSSGDITAGMKKILNELDIVTTSGDVAATFKEKPKSLKVNFKGDSGKPSIQLEDIISKDIGENHAIVVIGEGDKTLTVTTTSGDFTLKQK
ncbi:DUF4097 family beta strand repeat-containing protein [Lysinibacillus sp. KU-BSD001]|uniref:DUF4097 family beta strand repeat-containing protein n=1 Tax=Lysinibacillus sp. KU-BSD001 TaxID=3141328 RepID=UPI0036F13FF8